MNGQRSGSNTIWEVDVKTNQCASQPTDPVNNIYMHIIIGVVVVKIDSSANNVVFVSYYRWGFLHKNPGANVFIRSGPEENDKKENIYFNIK